MPKKESFSGGILQSPTIMGTDNSKEEEEEVCPHQVSSSFRILEEVGRGAISSLPSSSFREEQHPVLTPVVVVLL
jgi:hypothetical protein